MPNLKLDEEHKYRFATDVFGTDKFGRPIKIEGKEHYKFLMAQGDYVPFERAQELAEEYHRKRGGDGYKPSDELVLFLRHIKATADSRGNVQLGSRALAKMKEFGVSFDSVLPPHLKDKPLEGGMV